MTRNREVGLRVIRRTGRKHDIAYSQTGTFSVHFNTPSQ